MTLRQVFSPLALTLAAAGIAVTATGFALISAEVALPVHWGLDGKPDLTMPRTVALLMPVLIVAVLWGLFAAIDRWGPKARKDGGVHAFRVAVEALTALIVVMQAGIVAIGLGAEIDMVRIAAASVAVLAIALGNIMPKTQPNTYAGLRIGTTLSDPANWQATHRLTGWLLVASGIVFLPLALIVPVGPWLFACLVATLVVPIVVGTIYSVALARRRRTA